MQRSSGPVCSKQILSAVVAASAALVAGGCDIDGRRPDTLDSSSPGLLRGVPDGSDEDRGTSFDTAASAADLAGEMLVTTDAGSSDEGPELAPDLSVTRDPLLTRFSPTPLPSEEPDCLVSSRRIPGKDDPQSLYLGIGYYGWAEWVEGTYGSCDGVQWLRFHLQSDVPGPFELRYLVNDGTPTAVGFSWPEGLAGRVNATDPEVIHDGPLLRDARVICALVALPELPRSEWPVFGLYQQRRPRENRIVGTLC